MADRLTSRYARDLSDDKLSRAYRSILSILDEYDIAATFAFVGAFSQSPRDFERIRGDIEALSCDAPRYLKPVLRNIDETHGAGWHGHHYVDAVMDSRAAHEIALHGVTHVPWTSVDASFADAELRLVAGFEGPIANSRTFVFPRNLVAHTTLLSEYGFEGFRTACPNRSRTASYLSEFNVFEIPEQPSRANSNIIHIPAGYFLNRRAGIRKLVPPAVTGMRAKRLLDAAATSGGVVHYWLHPENVAGAPSTLKLLRTLARDVAAAREAGHCEVATQREYCKWAGSLL